MPLNKYYWKNIPESLNSIVSHKVIKEYLLYICNILMKKSIKTGLKIIKKNKAVSIHLFILKLVNKIKDLCKLWIVDHLKENWFLIYYLIDNELVNI